MVGHLLSWIWTIPRVPYLFLFVYFCIHKLMYVI